MTADSKNTGPGASDVPTKKLSFRSSQNSDALLAKTDGSELGLVNPNFHSQYKPTSVGFKDLGSPEELEIKLGEVGYHCAPFYAVQLSLILNTHLNSVKCMLLEGPSGCGKSFLAKSLAKITGAELMCLSCYKGMNLQHLVESPSTLGMVNAMAGKGQTNSEDLMNLGIISRAYLTSQTKPVILLIDEIDKVDVAIDTFFLGPIQDGRIWLESRPPIDCNIDNLLVIFTKNFNRRLDDAFLRRVHPMKMSYLDSTLERRVLSKHCMPQLVNNLVWIAERMRNSEGTYQFERPPAPEELLAIGHYVQKMLEWKAADFGWVGKNVWAMIAKSEHDRAVMDHMLRFHPDFLDPLHLDGKNASKDVIYARLGRLILQEIIEDPDAARRERAWMEMEYT